MQILYNSEEQITKMILDKQKGKKFLSIPAFSLFSSFQ